jgi:hypothetical protein
LRTIGEGYIYTALITSQFKIPKREYAPKLSLTEGGRVNQQPPALHEEWMVGGQETLFYWVPVWYRNMDLGFLCEVGVHYCYLRARNYLLSCQLSCTRECLMRRFYVDDNHAFKKEQKVRD